MLVKAEYSAQSAAFVPPSGGNSCAASAALSYAQWADFITGLPVYSLSVATGFRCTSSGTSLLACIDISPFIGVCKALKLHFYFPKERNEISELHNGSTAADAAVTSRRVSGSMKSTLRVDEIPACAGMKCSRVAPARNTRAKLGYVAGLEEPRKLGFVATAFVTTRNLFPLNTFAGSGTYIYRRAETDPFFGLKTPNRGKEQFLSLSRGVRLGILGP